MNKENIIELARNHWSALKNRGTIVDKILSDPNMRFVYKCKPEQTDTLLTDLTEKKKIKNIKAVLNLLGYKYIDIEKKLASKNNKNWIKIGRAVTKFDKKFEDMWKKICNNTGSSSEKLCIILSANPLDVITASYKRKWTSCMNPYDGHSALSQNYFKSYTMIAYLVQENDLDISNPIGRVLLHAFIEKRDETQVGIDDLKISIPFNSLIQSDTYIFFNYDTVYGRFNKKRELRELLNTVNLDLFNTSRVLEKKSRIILECRGAYNNSLPNSRVFFNFVFKDIEYNTEEKTLESKRKKPLLTIDNILFASNKERTETINKIPSYYTESFQVLKKLEKMRTGSIKYIRRSSTVLNNFYNRMQFYQRVQLIKLYGDILQPFWKNKKDFNKILQYLQQQPDFELKDILKEKYQIEAFIIDKQIEIAEKELNDLKKQREEKMKLAA